MNLLLNYNRTLPGLSLKKKKAALALLLLKLTFLFKSYHPIMSGVLIMKLFGSNELQNDVIQKNLCIGCGACNHLCPYFRSYKGQSARLFPCMITEGRCFAYCPKIEVDLDELSVAIFGRPYSNDPLGHRLSVHMSRAGESAVKGSFQAGGTVTALMQFALEKSSIDGAILTDRKGLQPEPTIATTAEDIRRCASSKYIASPTMAALNRAVKGGFTNLGVVSTPCQVTALAQMRSNPLTEESFIDPTGLVIGLFCTWALDFRSFETFIRQRVDVDKITKIDIPPPPAEIMKVFLDDGTKEFALSEIRQFVPETCSYCIDMTSEFSDISVGVMEGRPDMNTIIIRTERGQKIVDDAIKEGYLILTDIPEKNLGHLSWAAGNKKKRALAKAQQQNLINRPDGDGTSYLRIEKETLREIIA